MGQQLEIVAGSSALRRIILVLSVAALMAVMLVAMAAPAFAKPSVTCADQPTGDPDFGKGRSFHAGFHPCNPNQ